MSEVEKYPEIHINFEYFLKNEKRFLRKYGPRHLLIKNKRVVGVFDNCKDAFLHGTKKYIPGTYNIQECPSKIQYIFISK